MPLADIDKSAAFGLDTDRLPALNKLDWAGVDFAIRSAHIDSIGYLAEGRNAWHSTWSVRYYPKSLSFHAPSLKKSAENRRIQGSVFSIRELPCLCLVGDDEALIGVDFSSGGSNYLRISPALKRPLFAKNLLARMVKLADSQLIWVRTSKIDVDSIEVPKFRMWKSSSSGPRFYLNWQGVDNPRALPNSIIAAAESANVCVSVTSALEVLIRAAFPLADICLSDVVGTFPANGDLGQLGFKIGDTLGSPFAPVEA